MKLTIVSIGDLTSNGNHIVKMQRKVEVDTALGTMRQSETYYAAVKADAVKVSQGQEIDLDLTEFDITVRAYDFVDEQTGEEKTVDLKWLSLKQ